MAGIYQLKVTLGEIEPPIWRRFQVAEDVLLFDLHKILQSVMGWTNSHLHQFVAGEKMYANPDYEEDWDDRLQTDYSSVRLNALVKKTGDSLVYEYDFGDGWLHEIVLESLLAGGPRVPRCLEGGRHCPPEDCGGAHGYKDLLVLLKDKTRDDYESTMEWLGGEFDPEAFDAAAVNERLTQKDYGCISLLD